MKLLASPCCIVKMVFLESEQELELEALEALFAHEGEFEKLSASTFKLNLLPFPDAEEVNHVGVTLYVEFPPSKNIDQSGYTEMNHVVESVLTSYLGSSVVYNIADSLQAWLREHNYPALSMHEEMVKRLQNSEDDNCIINSPEEFQVKSLAGDQEFRGLENKLLCSPQERVTEEEFILWSENFRQEMSYLGIWKNRFNETERSLSGRQMFERNEGLAAIDIDSLCAESI
ncbi:RWD domain-containing protein [Cardiosporidium cionae]|uniref:RWD domain-containing protein n=1 Tax=Cardiosporidium cionae TaxID=476202 RepID=A0ABQ7JGH3_9APIC|nr:RWD domain-containing protein [Cardiosporidium cionae]|eukprot:KAF8823039.1 RWD domain-containing protein [Cardiosporidium cionae]